VKDRILFHKWSKEIDIFTSGIALHCGVYKNTKSCIVEYTRTLSFTLWTIQEH